MELGFGIITQCLVNDLDSWEEPRTIRNYLKNKYGAEIMQLAEQGSGPKAEYWRERIEKESNRLKRQIYRGSAKFGNQIKKVVYDVKVKNVKTDRR